MRFEVGISKTFLRLPRQFVGTGVKKVGTHSPCAFRTCQQVATAASYVATMKTIRQVKTVFIIFIAFVCCWSPYVVVLLYDSSDSLPLTVHLYTSMLAHLHASLNFAIYSLSNRTYRAGYRNIASHLASCCCGRKATRAATSAAIFSSRDTFRTNARVTTWTRGDVKKTLVTAECFQLQEIDE